MKYKGTLYGRVGGAYIPLAESVDENSIVVDEQKVRDFLSEACGPVDDGKPAEMREKWIDMILDRLQGKNQE